MLPHKYSCGGKPDLNHFFLQKARAFLRSLYPALDLPPTAQKPLTLSDFLALMTAFIHLDFLPMALFFLDTYLPCLFLVMSPFFRPPTVLAFLPLYTQALASLPLATFETLFFLVDLDLLLFFAAFLAIVLVCFVVLVI